MTTQTEVLLSTDDLAARYQVSRATVHQWIYKGTAPRSLKIGKHRRFHMDDVLNWEEAQADPEPQPAA